MGLEFVYDPACAALLDSGGAKGALFQITAPLDLLSAIAYGAVNSSTRKMTSLPSIAAAPTSAPPEPGFGASSVRCQTTWPLFALSASALPPYDAMNTHPSSTTGVELKPVSSPVEAVENAHTGVSLATAEGVSPLGSGCVRVLATSWPYMGH